MPRTLIGAFLIAHGLITMMIWIPNPKTVEPPPPMDTSHSWILGDVRSLALTFAMVAGLAIVVAGIAYLASVGWWPTAAAIAGGLSLLLFAIFFSPWWIAGIAISAGILVAAFQVGLPV